MSDVDMTQNQLAKTMRDIADRLEAMPQCDVTFNMSIICYDGNTLERLRWINKFATTTMIANSSESTHWIEGAVLGCDLTAFYPAGLLGKPQKKILVTVEEHTDLSLLQEQEPTAGQPAAAPGQAGSLSDGG